MSVLTYDVLSSSAIAGDGVGLRARIELEPLGGSGDKVFPASFGVSRPSVFEVSHRIYDAARTQPRPCFDTPLC